MDGQSFCTAARFWNNSWVTNKAATEQETSIWHEECSICGYWQNENTVIDKLQNVQPVKPSKTNLSKRKVTGVKVSYIYTGKAIKPSVKVSCVSKNGYTVTYKDNKNVGTATIQ